MNKYAQTSNIPSGNFRAWINPDGKLFVVPNQMTHRRWLEDQNITEEEALAEGCIRLTMEGFPIFYANDLVKSFHLLKKIIEDLYKQRGDRNIWIEDKVNKIDRKTDFSTFLTWLPSDITKKESDKMALKWLSTNCKFAK